MGAPIRYCAANSPAEERKRILPADGAEVTLLSVEEVARYMPTRFSRVCERTPAADPKRSGDGHEKWWTRTVDDRGRVNEVSYRGDILTSGMDSENVGVRPVIRVDPAA